METKAIYRFARISAFKAREVTREIQGLSVSQALDVLRWTPKKAARLVDKTLRSAVANAENNHNARPESLVVKEAVVGEGPTMKRYQPKARGSAGPIRKRTSHIRIILTDEAVVPEKKTAKTKSSARKAAPSKDGKKTRTRKTAPKAEKPAEASAENTENATA